MRYATQKSSLSNLHLQLSLYYNVLFSLIYFVTVGSASITKVLYYEDNISIIVIAIWLFVEPFRLHYGFSGNLREKVADVATYLLISIFPQIPFIIYLAYIHPIQFPIDPIVGSLMFILLFGQGMSTMRALIRSQTAQFMRLCEDDKTS